MGIRKRILGLFCLLFALNYSPNALAQYKSENLFYIVDSEPSFQSFKKNISQVSIAAPQVYSFTKTGIVYGQIDSRITNLAQKHEVKVMPLITNGSFDWKLLDAFLTNKKAQRRAIKMMVQLAKAHHFYGWQFDIENLHIKDRQVFTKFYRKAAKALHKAGFTLSAAVVPTNTDYAFHTAYHRFLYEDWRGAYNFKAIAQAGDFLSLMTYSQHTRRTPPGPVAGIPWMKKMVQYLLDQGISRNKISLGIPFYSTHWYADYSKKRGGFMNGKSVSYQRAKSLVVRNKAKLRWMKEPHCHFAYWSNDGTFEYVFIEDARSLKAKLTVLKKFRLRGISVWVMGQEDPADWAVIKSNLKTVK